MEDHFLRAASFFNKGMCITLRTDLVIVLTLVYVTMSGDFILCGVGQRSPVSRVATREHEGLLGLLRLMTPVPKSGLTQGHCQQSVPPGRGGHSVA